MPMLTLALPITNPVQVFALVMVIMVVVPLLCARLRIPSVIGLLIAGLAIGPNALNLLARDATMVLLGTVGLLYIMFLAGLELDLDQFQRYRHRSLLLGLATYALPQGFGTLIAREVLGFDWFAAVLLGSVFASHTLLAYPIVSRLGIAKSGVVATAVGATIFTDTLALLVLAVIAGAVEEGPSVWFVVQLLGLLGLLVVGAIWGLPRVGRWFYRIGGAGGVTEFIFILAAVFVTATLAEAVGVEAIIGAFLAGLGLNRLVPEHGSLMGRIHFVGNALFIPFFLLATGMLVDLRVLVSGEGAWVVAGAMVGTVTVTKWLAAESTRFLFGFDADERRVVFALTVPQAAATLAAVLIGYEIGLFGSDVLNGAILMILVTCFLGPWLAERYGRRLALREAVAPREHRGMPQRILIPLANPETAERMIEVALLIRDPSSSQPVYPITIARDGPDVRAEVVAGEKMLGHAVLHAAAADVPVLPLTRVDLSVARGLTRAIKETSISTVVMGWDGVPAAQRFIFGNISDQLLAETPAMVLLCRTAAPLNTARRVLLSVPPLADHEPGFSDAVRVVKRLARQLSARLVLVAPSDELAGLSDSVDRIQPRVPVAGFELPEGSDLVQLLDAQVQPEDVLVQLSLRQGARSWQPGREHLPRLLAQRFRANTLLVLYLAEAEVDTLVPSAQAGVVPPLLLPLPPEHVALDLAGHTTEDVLRQLLRGHFADEPEVLGRAVDALAHTQAGHSPELVPGIVFYHAHTPEVVGTQFFVGVSRHGLNLSHVGGPAHVVLVLLNAEATPSDRHLQHLAFVTRIARHRRMLGYLRMATTKEEVLQTLGEHLGVPSG